MRTLADLDAMRSAQGSAVASRYHFVSYEDLATNTLETEQVIASMELFGREVIPQFDKDPEHSTTRYRREAAEKAGETYVA